MGLTGKLLSFTRAVRNGLTISDAKMDPGGGPNLTPEHLNPPGDDSHPLPGDYGYLAPLPAAGRYAVLGYVDPVNPPGTDPGEKRIYARDADTGAVVVSVWLRNDGSVALANMAGSVTLGADGSIIGQNGAGSFELQAAGDFIVNGVTIAADGSVTIPTSLTLNSKEIAEHTHSQNDDSGGNTEQDTGPNNG